MLCFATYSPPLFWLFLSTAGLEFKGSLDVHVKQRKGCLNYEYDQSLQLELNLTLLVLFSTLKLTYLEFSVSVQFRRKSKNIVIQSFLLSIIRIELLTFDIQFPYLICVCLW